MPLNVHLQREVPEALLALLREKTRPTVHITVDDTAVPDECEILVSGHPEREHLLREQLRAVVVPFAGVPMATSALLQAFSHLSLHNLPYNAIPTAEMGITLLLTAAKFVLPLDRELRQHNWTARYGDTSAQILYGKTALVLGYGRVGQHMATICRALGMNVVGVSRTLDSTRREGDAEDAVQRHTVDELPSLLSRADVLLIALPLTPKTKDLIDEDALSRLPAHAVVVNVGRGEVVNEEAFFRALQRGQILAAGIDVWYSYPADEASRSQTPPSRFPFHELENVVMSPHRAGWLSAAETLRMTCLADLLNAAAANKPLPYLVDPMRGY